MPTQIEPGSWLTAKRLRAHAAIVALCLWSLYAWNLATPGLLDRNGNLKGTDFLHFYMLGTLAIAHRGADLYDMHAQAALAEQRVPEAAGIRYFPSYPPQVSILFAPPAHLSYGWALAAWWICSTAIYGTCCYVVWRVCPRLRDYGGTVLLLAAAFPAFFHLIAWGQTSAMALACFTLMFFLLRESRDFLAGIALGCLIFKPQLGLAAAVVFMATAAWRTVAGAILSAAAQLLLGVLYYGTEALREWIRTLRSVQTLWPLLEPKLYQTHCLRSFWSMLLKGLVPWPEVALGLYLLSAVGVLALTISRWRRRSVVPLPLKYSVLLLATVLVAPHFTVYDLVILVPAFLLLADWILTQRLDRCAQQLGTLLYFIYMLPLIGPFARRTHVQLSVVVMTIALYLIWKISRKIDPDMPTA